MHGLILLNMARVSTTITALSKVLAHFSLKEMKDFVIPVFEGKVTFRTVIEIISKENLSLSAKSLREVLLNIMSEEHRHYVQDKIFYLKLLDVAVHERKQWMSWELLDVTERGDHWMEENLLLKEIQHSFTRENLFGVFQVLMQKGLFWIMISLKLKNMDRGIKYQPPIYFAYVPGDVYLFTTRVVPKGVFKCLIKSVLGYNKVQKCLLTGRSVVSLFRLLKKKEQKACSWKDVDDKFLHHNLSIIEVADSKRGLNLIQSRKRETYARNCIGEDPPILNTFVIQASGNKWKGSSAVPHFVGRDFETILILKSKHISLTVEKLIANGTITTPAPPHFENLISLGSNNVLIEPDESASEDDGD